MNIGIIADGNRRWAKNQNISAKDGHTKGFTVITDEVFPACFENPDCTGLTVYGFSTENWKRSPLEIKNLMEIYSLMCDRWEKIFSKKPIQLKWCGRRDRIPEILRKKIERIEASSLALCTDFSKKNNSQEKIFTLYLCIDYGGRDEIIRAVTRAKAAGNAENFEDFLEIPEIDLIIRTGGEQRISNFCIWQGAYAEFFFIKKFLPELKKSDVEDIIEKFSQRERRKGGGK